MTHSTSDKKRSLTPLYCLHQAAYFFAIAGCGSFAVTYLITRGFNAAQAGMMLAAGNILSCALQPLIASHIDRTSSSLLLKLIPGFLITSLLSFGSVGLLALPKVMICLLYVLGYLSFSITVPLCNSLCAYYSSRGYRINYAAGSGVGSLSFSFASLIFGFIIALLGPRAMILSVLVFLIIQIFLSLLYPPIISGAPKTAASAPQAQSLSIPAFCRRYRIFMLTMLGVVCLAACHAMAESFLIQLFTRLGGGSEDVGIALFIACITAAPFLLFFEKIQGRFGVSVMMRLSGLFYIAKATLLILAPTIQSIYIIELLQFCTYGFVYPSLYYLVLRRIDIRDMAKGQALASSLFTLGVAFGNSSGGVFIEAFGLNAMLAIAGALACAGTLLINATINKKDIA